MHRLNFHSRRAMRITTVAAVTFLWGCAAHAADLTVEILGTRSQQGSVAAALFAGSAGWLKPDQAVQGQFVPAAGKVVVLFRGLAPGRYAVSAYHDENNNAKMDMNAASLPIEPYGFSRNAQGHMGPPAYDDAALDLQSDATIQIHLR